jgi:hypothetical protein
MNPFLLGFLNASAFAGLFVFLFLFGLYLIARATRPTSLPRYNWDREPILQKSGVRIATQDRPRPLRPQDRVPQLEL